MYTQTDTRTITCTTCISFCLCFTMRVIMNTCKSLHHTCTVNVQYMYSTCTCTVHVLYMYCTCIVHTHLLILLPSFNLSPIAPLLAALSLPAKSTRLNLLTFSSTV